MPAGMRAWTAGGALQFDTATLTGRVIGIVPIGAGASGYFDPARNAGEKLFAVVNSLNSSGRESAEVYVGDGVGNTDPNGGRIWYAMSPGTSGFIVYGVY